MKEKSFGRFVFNPYIINPEPLGQILLLGILIGGIEKKEPNPYNHDCEKAGCILPRG